LEKVFWLQKVVRGLPPFIGKLNPQAYLFGFLYFKAFCQAP
jgi:hypothetical protein